MSDTTTAAPAAPAAPLPSLDFDWTFIVDGRRYETGSLTFAELERLELLLAKPWIDISPMLAIDAQACIQVFLERTLGSDAALARLAALTKRDFEVKLHVVTGR